MCASVSQYSHEDSSRLIAQDDSAGAAAMLRRHPPTHLETIPSGVAFTLPDKYENSKNKKQKRIAVFSVFNLKTVVALIVSNNKNTYMVWDVWFMC